MKVKRAYVLAVAVLAFGSISGAAQAAQPNSVPAATHYKTCKAMNDGKYPHGVGKRGAKDSTTGKRVTNFMRDNKEYKRYATSASKGGYRDLDRDDDGIACEKL